jgi:hypothetical protein
LVVFAGLIKQTTYTNLRAAQCSLWQAKTWDVQNCKSDLGWQSPLDSPVFFLKAYFPDTLTTIQNPQSFGYPFNSIIATPVIQTYLHRWDSVDLSNYDVRAAQKTCLWGIEAIPFFIFLLVLGALLTFGPVLQSLKTLFAILGILASVIFYFLLALFAGTYYILKAPDFIYYHSLDRLAELQKAERIIADKELLARLRRREYRKN